MKPNQSKTNSGRKQKGKARLRSSEWLGGTPETVLQKLESLDRLATAIESGMESSGVLLEVTDGKPVIKVCALNEVWKDEDFMEAVNWIGNGSKNEREELQIWRDAFLEAARMLDVDLNAMPPNGPDQRPPI